MLNASLAYLIDFRFKILTNSDSSLVKTFIKGVDFKRMLKIHHLLIGIVNCIGI